LFEDVQFEERLDITPRLSIFLGLSALQRKARTVA
jgi:hypothetical protein